jgi:hypothetical protein
MGDPVDHLDAVEKEKIPATDADKTQILGHPARDLITALTRTARDYCTEYLKRFSWNLGRIRCLLLILGLCNLPIRIMPLLPIVPTSEVLTILAPFTVQP